MDSNYWQQQRLKRSSISAGTSYSAYNNGLQFNDNVYANYGQQQFNQILQQQAAAAHAHAQSHSPSQQQRSSYYETHYPLYHCDWSHLDGIDVQNIVVSSYREDPTNKLQVLHGFPNYDHSNLQNQHQQHQHQMSDEDDIVMDGIPSNQKPPLQGYNFYKVSEVNVNYPVTNLQWDPSMATGQTNVERLATSSECLRIYEVETDTLSGDSTLVEKLTLTNSRTKNFNQLPPLTSFDWNKVDTNEIITGSIDTTCTLWDLSKGGSSMAKTQLIAHDSEVFDVKFLHGSKHLFTSCGNDGSIRVFDLRSLEHSTIVYEPQLNNTSSSVSGSSSSNSQYLRTQPLLKLAASHVNVNHVAAIEASSNKVLVLDLRYPGIPIRTLDHHSAPVNSIAWHPTKNYLLTGADDCQALVYDLTDLEHAKPESGKNNYNSNNGAGSGGGSSNSSAGSSHNGDGSNGLPVLGYTDHSEINSVTWDTEGDWIGVVAGKGFQVVKAA